MVDYADSTSLQARLGADAYLRVFDRDGDGVADTAAIAQATGRATAYIDARLRARGLAPFTTAPAIIGYIATDLAIWYATNVPIGTATAQQLPYTPLFKQVDAVLKDLADDANARMQAQDAGPVALSDEPRGWSDPTGSEG